MDLGLSWCIRTTRRSHAHHFPSGQQIAFRDCRCNPVGPEQGRMPLSFDPQGTGEQIFQKSNTLVFQSQHFQLSNCCCWKFEAFSGKPSLLHFWSALFTSWQKWRNTFCLLGKSGAFLSTFPQIKYFFFFFFLPTPQIIRKLFHYHIYVLQVWLWVLILTSTGKNFECFNLFHDFKDWLESIGERAHFNAVLMFRCFWCLDGLGSLAGDSQLKMFTPGFSVFGSV